MDVDLASMAVAIGSTCLQDPVDWSDSRTRYIHSVLTGFGGTCASLPVLYVAIGRRLGWPLYLVGAKLTLCIGE